MDLSVAAAFFDDQAVYDSYSAVLLFYGQPDLYDSAERDSEAGWRRTMSVVPGTSLPAHGCIKLDSDNFVIGRVIQDYFQGSPIREHLLLHPADGLISVAPTSTFLAAEPPAELYAAQSWLKARKFEESASKAEPIYGFFCHTSESLPLGNIVKDTRDVYHRIASIAVRSGLLQTATVYQLGSDVLRSIDYSIASTVYDSTTNSYPLGAANAIQAVIEGYRTNYLYLTNAAEKFERADKVVTVLKSVVPDPKTSDRFVDSSVTYQVIDRQADGALAWAIHARPE